MSIYEETIPVTLLGGPHDGTDLDVRPSDDEVRRPTDSGMVAVYLRIHPHLFQFVSYRRGEEPA